MYYFKGINKWFLQNSQDILEFHNVLAMMINCNTFNYFLNYFLNFLTFFYRSASSCYLTRPALIEAGFPVLILKIIFPFWHKKINKWVAKFIPNHYSDRISLISCFKFSSSICPGFPGLPG
jgi:hypothetical protein